MMPFYLSSSAERTGILAALFMALLLMLTLLFITFGKKNRALWFINASVFLVFFALLIILCVEQKYIAKGLPLIFRSPIPLWGLWCAVAAFFLYAAGSFAAKRRKRERTIDLSSIKEAMDTLPAAVCYFTEKGMVKLCNLQMYRLFYSLAQCDLQSLAELHAALNECDAHTGVIRLSGDEPVYLFPNGKAWLFTEGAVQLTRGDAYTEAVFYDVTELYEKRVEIEAQTEKLRELGKNIRTLSENVVAMTKEEMLSFKTALHDRMGAGLIAARQALLQNKPTEEMDALIGAWKRSVALIKQDNDGDRGELPELISDAAAIGVDISIKGELPADAQTHKVFLDAMRECLTNCVRHANGTELVALVECDDKNYTLTVTNNGEPPRERIVPRGGLANLMKRASHLGGAAHIQSLPAFMLIVTIPRERGILQ